MDLSFSRERESTWMFLSFCRKAKKGRAEEIAFSKSNFGWQESGGGSTYTGARQSLSSFSVCLFVYLSGVIVYLSFLFYRCCSLSLCLLFLHACGVSVRLCLDELSRRRPKTFFFRLSVCCFLSLSVFLRSMWLGHFSAAYMVDTEVFLFAFEARGGGGGCQASRALWFCHSLCFLVLSVVRRLSSCSSFASVFISLCVDWYLDFEDHLLRKNQQLLRPSDSYGR